MPNQATFQGVGGADPVLNITKFQKGMTVTPADCVAAGETLRARILDRTARGTDANGQPFAPYSQRGPYYFYPNRKAGVGKFTEKQRKASSARLNRKIDKAGVRTPYGLRFESYAAAKAAFGRTHVDLFGLDNGPHMLNGLIVQSPSSGESVVRIGFYGEEAGRAKGNNEGIGRLPKRQFFKANADDLNAMREVIVGRMKARV